MKSPYAGASSAIASIDGDFGNSLRCVTMSDEQYVFRAMTSSPESRPQNFH
jgi:hypothetical protein